METTTRYVNESSLLEEGLDRLRGLFGPDWEVSGSFNIEIRDPSTPLRPIHEVDGVLTISDPGGGRSGPILVEIKHRPTPQVITQLIPRLQRIRRLIAADAVLLIAGWLSPRSREILQSAGFSYLDLTGNVSIRLNRPGILVSTVGEQRAPDLGKTYARQLKGDKAGALVRALIDVTPPHRATDLAAATGVSLAYVSRLLDTMQREALISRRGRVIDSVDWRGLLRARSATYDLLQTNPPASMVAPKGIAVTLERLASDLDAVQARGRVAVTGPLAAVTVAPLTVGGQLMIHVEDSSSDGLSHVHRSLGLLPATTAAGDVLLLRSSSPSIFIGRRTVHGAPHVALSQLALDCLGGTGRMPAEGEAVVDYMIRNENKWRLAKLEDWSDLRR